MKNRKSCIASFLLLLALASNVSAVIALTTMHIVVTGIFAVIGIGCIFLALVVFESKLNALLDIREDVITLDTRSSALVSKVKSIDSKLDVIAKQAVDLDIKFCSASKMLESKQDAMLETMTNIDRHLCNGMNGILSIMQPDVEQS